MPDPNILAVTSPGKSDRDVGARLTEAPPLPPDTLRPAREHMKKLMSSERPELGIDAGNPFVQKMESLKSIELGIRQAVSADPNLSGAMAQLLQAAQAAVLGSITGSMGPMPAPIAPQLPPPGLAAGGGPSPMPGPAVMPMPAPGVGV